MKSELLVIADQHAAVNTFPGLVIDQEFLEGYIAMREEPSGFKLKTTTAMSGLHKPAITLNKPATIDIPAIDRSKLKPIDSNQVVPGMIIFHPTFGSVLTRLDY